ncbi:MAG TPA: hypothetical protein PKA03_15945 [Tabrizicola sp.]|nr:hypothetical protein [Tabrizicola sp.]
MALTVEQTSSFARAYEAAWNSGDPAQVAGCYSADRGIVINRG